MSGYLGQKNATAEQALITRRGTYDRSAADARKTANTDGTGRNAIYAVVGDKDLDIHKGEIAYCLIENQIDNFQDTVLSLTSLNGVGDMQGDLSPDAKQKAKDKFMNSIAFAGIAMHPIEYMPGEHGTTQNEFALQIGGTVSITARGGALATGHYVKMALPDDERIPSNLRYDHGRPLSKRTLVPKQVESRDYFEEFRAKIQQPAPRIDRKKEDPTVAEAYFSQAIMNYLVVHAALIRFRGAPPTLAQAFTALGFDNDRYMAPDVANAIANALANPAVAFNIGAGPVPEGIPKSRAIREFVRLQHEFVTSVAEGFDAFHSKIFGRVIIGCEKDGVADIQLI